MEVEGSRRVVTVWATKPNEDGEVKPVTKIGVPKVFSVPVRHDIVQDISALVRMNSRQPHAIFKYAGHQTSAESWGTGRAVARIPRVRGGGTHRSGQGAYGNMCRGGHTFGATKLWKRWHRKVPVGNKRFAVCSSIAGSGSPALVMARGHRIQTAREIPLVVGDDLQSFKKTKDAALFLKNHNCWSDVVRVFKNIKPRPGKGKMRNRRKKKGRGPLIVYNKDFGVSRAFRNIPGVDTAHVDSLSILDLAPGGQVGRFIIWTESAFRRLNSIFGSYFKPSEKKKGFNLPYSCMANANLMQILHHPNILASLRRRMKQKTGKMTRRVNPLKNYKKRVELNPYAAVQKKITRELQAVRTIERRKRRDERRAAALSDRKARQAREAELTRVKQQVADKKMEERRKIEYSVKMERRAEMQRAMESDVKGVQESDSLSDAQKDKAVRRIKRAAFLKEMALKRAEKAKAFREKLRAGWESKTPEQMRAAKVAERRAKMVAKRSDALRKERRRFSKMKRDSGIEISNRDAKIVKRALEIKRAVKDLDAKERQAKLADPKNKAILVEAGNIRHRVRKAKPEEFYARALKRTKNVKAAKKPKAE